MDPLYIVIAVVMGLAAYFLFTGRRRPVDKMPVRREPARREESAAKSAGQSRRAAEDEDDNRDESAPLPEAARKRHVKPPPGKFPSASPAANPDEGKHEKLPPAQPPSATQADDAKPEEAGADGPPCPCGSSKPFSRCHGVDAPDGAVQEAPQPSPRGETRSSFRYFGKTVLLYEPSHGNQIEYYDRNGKSYLWYPGNGTILAGEWRLEGDMIYSRYGIPTHNPVTGQHDVAGAWSSCPLVQMFTTEVDIASGDFLDLASGRLPYRLPAHPGFRSLQEAKLKRGNR